MACNQHTVSVILADQTIDRFDDDTIYNNTHHSWRLWGGNVPEYPSYIYTVKVGATFQPHRCSTYRLSGNQNNAWIWIDHR